jgi:putative ABC transport system permease protein
MWWEIPLRNLWRNRRRTVLSIVIVSLGTGVSLFVLGFVESSRLQIQASTVQEFGNLQIASPDVWADTAEGYDYLMSPDQVARVDDVLSQEPRFGGRTRQLQFPGLLAAGRSTQVVRVTSLEPGNGLLDTADLIVDGRDLESTDTAAILVGRTLAERLSLSIGDVVILTLTTVGGAYNASPFQVVGTYRFPSEQVERQSVFVPLAFGQALLNTDGIDRVVVALNQLSATDAARSRIQAGLEDAGLRYEAKTWEELSPIYRQLASYFDLLFGFLSLAVTVLVFFIILQVLTLAFLERSREVGTLRALGTTRGEVFRLFFTESGWLAVVGSLTGVLFGVLLGLGFNAVGIEWRPPGTVEPVTLAVRLSAGIAVIPFAIGLAATLLSALFPSIQTARIRVVDALRVE